MSYWIALLQAVPIIDKWVQLFVDAYNAKKFGEAEAKARKGNVTELRKEIGKHL